jgi:hypothetical protein
MPRNGSGVYTLPASSSFNPAVTGQSATAPDWNALAADLAAAMSQSVSSDGQTTITGNMPFAGFRATGLGNPVNAQDAVTQAFLASFGGSYLRGLTLSNDSGTPNSVLDIAAGSCADSTNAVPIIGTAFTKSTAGSWVAGTGNNGMGSGLTIANSTWYHVFPIINNGSYDVYFDTSITAANKPASTTAFRRAGSFLTDGSAHIIAFIQSGDLFLWMTPVNSLSGGSFSSTPTQITMAVPLGVSVIAQFAALGTVGSPGARNILFYSPLQNAQTANSPAGNNMISWGAADQQSAAQLEILTDTAQHVQGVSDNPTTMNVTTIGWIDRRGRDA